MVLSHIGGLPRTPTRGPTPLHSSPVPTTPDWLGEPIKIEDLTQSHKRVIIAPKVGIRWPPTVSFHNAGATAVVSCPIGWGPITIG